jgi:hypothetical protein
VTATWHIAVPPTVPLYWRARPGAVCRGLLVGGLVHDQYHVSAPSWPAERRPTAQPAAVSSIRCSSHAGAGQQVLHPVRARVPGGLGQRPAVVILEFGQQPVHHVTAGQAGLPSGEARRDLRHQVIEQVLVIVMVYAGVSGCRLICLFHKLA